MEDWDSLIWDQIPFVAFDVETTGFGPAARVCQVATASFYQDGLRSRSWLIYPGCPIPPETTAIHGITDEMVAGAPMFKDVLPEILEELRRAPWVAHNLRFDSRMLAREIPPELWPRGLPTLCTLEHSKKHCEMTKGRRGHKLADLANVFSVDYKISELHDATYDTELLAHITRNMMRGLSIGRTFTRMSEDWL